MSTKKEDKTAILARRAAFIATAVAALTQNECKKSDPGPSPCLEPMPYDGDAGGGDDGGPEPMPCLSPLPAVQADAEPEPVPCLSVRMPDPDAGPPEPRPCLKPKLPEPRPCLSKAK
jgi:hypothetical protein